MATGSVKSAFKFESYKIDSLHLESKKDLRLLAVNEAIPSEDWNIDLRLRRPLFFEAENLYIGGVEARIFTLTSEGKREQEEQEDISPENIAVSLEAGIAGMFRVLDGEFDKKIEETLVKIQIPAILLPYLRATMTSLLANSGYGSVMFPLFNIHTIAGKTLQDTTVEVIKAEG
jgi:preprotein translocase subunit SecB